MPLENSTDFARIANNSFPGIAQPMRSTTSAEASNGTPSGQALENEPVGDEMTWKQYKEEYDKLMQMDPSQIGFWEWRNRLEELRWKFVRSEQRRGHGYDQKKTTLQDYRPIDVRAIQIEEGRIPGREDSNP
jgi:hypothetical protein